jgi:hypothetical protein
MAAAAYGFFEFLFAEIILIPESYELGAFLERSLLMPEEVVLAPRCFMAAAII